MQLLDQLQTFLPEHFQPAALPKNSSDLLFSKYRANVNIGLKDESLGVNVHFNI
jgi:hypothetical protein